MLGLDIGDHPLDSDSDLQNAYEIQEGASCVSSPVVLDPVFKQAMALVLGFTPLRAFTRK